MTERYLGSIITANPVEPSANVENSAASGVWNIHDPLIFGQASDWPDPSVPNPDKFVENLLSTFVYDGTGSSQTITNGIDLDGSGGLVWTKRRDSTSGNGPWLNDTERGITKYLTSADTSVETDNSGSISAVTSSGYTLGTFSGWNASGGDYVSWTFRKQPKFFDIVTWTGDGSGTRDIAHNLGTTIGFMVMKQRESTLYEWFAYHRGYTSNTGKLDSTTAFNTSSGILRPTPGQETTHFQVSGTYNGSGENHVAYLWAHNDSDGGFGANGDQDIIKCGSYDGNDGTQDINVGFEPQWLMIKNVSNTSNWVILDMMRNFIVDSSADSTTLRPNTNDNESSSSAGRIGPRSNGFGFISESGNDFNAVGTGYKYIYVAIRRGPMQTPTAATDVFAIDGESDTSPTPPTYNSDFPVDLSLMRRNVSGTESWYAYDRLRGGGPALQTNATDAEVTAGGSYNSFDSNVGLGTYTGTVYPNAFAWMFRRAPGFFDVVAYSGDSSSNRAVTHNLGVAPEFFIIKRRSSADNWRVTTTDAFPNGFRLNVDEAVQTGVSAFDGVSTPNATNFYVSNNSEVNASGETYVAYLFATLAGISKVGTYSGTGSDVNVDCGFTSGARFVLAKRTDSSGDWFVWDSTRGIVAGNDPYVLFNTTAAEVTNTDYIDPLSSGFTITSNAGSDLNTSGGTYLFLAIA